MGRDTIVVINCSKRQGENSISWVCVITGNKIHADGENVLDNENKMRSVE